MWAASVVLGWMSVAGAAEVEPHVFLRVRPEVRVNPSFIAGQDDSLAAVQNAAGVGVFGRQGAASALVEIQASQNWGARSSTVGTDSTAYAGSAWVQFETHSGHAWLRAGRQELHMLNGFYLSRAPWNPVGRRFDGLRGHVEAGDWVVDGFSMMLREPHPADDDYAASTLGDTLAGVFATWAGAGAVEPTAFVLGSVGGPTIDDSDRLKRWVAPAVRVEVDTESGTFVDLNVVVQVGDESGTPIRAYNTIVRTRQGFGGDWDAGAGLLFEQSSGHSCGAGPDCDPDVIRDPDLGFGRNHFLRGAADQVYGANVRDLGLNVDSAPMERLRLTLEGHWFQLTNPEGAWRRNGGSFQGQGWKAGNTDPNLGIEVDALFDAKIDKGIHIDGGLTWFQPVGVGAELTGDDAMVYAFVRNRYNF